MAFDLDKIIKNKKDTKIEERKRTIHKLFVYIGELDNVSQQTRDALTIYLQYRLKMRGADKLTVGRFNSMVTELLEKCCDKSFFEITPDDTDINFDKIMYHLKFAIQNKFRFQIYHEEDADWFKLVGKSSGKSNGYNRKLTKKDIEELFGGDDNEE